MVLQGGAIKVVPVQHAIQFINYNCILLTWEAGHSGK